MMALLELLLFAFVLMSMTIWFAVTMGTPWFVKHVVNRHPKQRIWLTRLWLWAPLWLALLVLATALLPGMASNILALNDHCLSHAAHHHHLCLFHPPAPAQHALAWLCPAGFALLVVSQLRFNVHKTWLMSRTIKTLARLSTPDEMNPHVRWLNHPKAMAYTAGWLKPKILLSTSLKMHLTDKQLDMVIAHEESHRRHRDPMWMMLDAMILRLYTKTTSHKLRRTLHLAIEQRCDDFAATQAGDRVTMAQTIVSVAKLHVLQPKLAVGLCQSNLEARVAHLLDPPHAPHTTTWMMPALAIILIALAMGPTHWSLEWLVSTILHLI